MFTRLCMAVLALCLLHHLLMVTLGHALVMGSSHDGGMIALHMPPVMMLDVRDLGTVAGHQLPSLPLSFLGDCPAQQAVFPLLMVLALLLGLVLLAGGQGAHGARRPQARPSRLVLAPLMPPQQRRAMLQVFTI
jgi:hypothetical protein